MFALDIKKYFLYSTVFVVGAAVLILEIIGTRVLAPWYGSTIFVWSSLITVTLAALALGYWSGGRIADKWSASFLLYGAICFSGITLFFLTPFSTFILTTTDSLGISLGPLVATALLFFIPLYLLGIVSPAALKVRARSLEHIGLTAGGLYALATAGSLAGGLLSGFFLAPNYAPKTIMFSLSFILILLGILGILIYSNGTLWMKGKMSLLGIVLVIAILTYYGYQALFHTEQTPEASSIEDGGMKERGITNTYKTVDEFGRPEYPTLFTSNGVREARVVYSEPSQYGDVTVFDFSVVRCFLVDGANESCWNFKNNVASEYVDDIVFALENAGEDIKDILVIGMGAGTLLKSLDGTDYRVDAVEINPVMIDVAERFFLLPENLDYKVFIDDGRHYLNTTEKKYDAIVLDICNVNQFNAHLWTKEFYELVKSHLKDPEKGVVIASRAVVNNEKTKELDHMIANAMRESFSHLYTSRRSEEVDEYDVAVFLATGQSDLSFPENVPALKKWTFDASYVPTVDATLDKSVMLFLPATESIRAQAINNFGKELLLPR